MSRSPFSSSPWTTSSEGGCLFPLLSSFIKHVSNENFNQFHAIDRELFALLLFSHGCEARQAILIMAFWMWLDVKRYCPQLVFKILKNLTPPEVSHLVIETVMCLRCLEDENFFFSVIDRQISNLEKFMELKRLNLHDLYQDRVRVLSKIREMANKVCIRSFNDILQATFGTSAVFNNYPNEGSINRSAEYINEGSSGSSSNRFSNFTPQSIATPPHPGVVPQPMFLGVANYAPREVGGEGSILGMPRFLPSQMMNFGAQMPPVYHLPNQQVQHLDFMNRFNVEQRMRNVRISEPLEPQVPPDERTLFLTFSKGYPITEAELRSFFTRRFGDFIESIFMPEVPPDEQVLFARVVARTAADMNRILALAVNRKPKFAIDGKHVWCRKYEKKTGQGGGGR